MVFIESPWFSAWRESHLSDDDFAALQVALMREPLAGDPIPGGRGLRKLRVALRGRGKRGGGRVIYVYRPAHDQTLLLYGYAKNEQGDLTPAQLKRLARVVQEEFDDGR